jgi:hypothetical protein
VSWTSRDQKWQVRIQRGGKRFYPNVIDKSYYYTDEDEAGQVAAQLEAWLDANPQLWRGLGESPVVRADQQYRNHIQRCGDAVNIDQADVPFASFHTTNVSPMQPAFFGKLLL